MDDLDMEEVEKYIKIVKENRPNFSKFKKEVALEKLGIVRKVQGVYKPTVSVNIMLWYLSRFNIANWLVTASVIPGFNIGDMGSIGERFIDNKKITGTIPSMVKQSVEFIMKKYEKKNYY